MLSMELGFSWRLDEIKGTCGQKERRAEKGRSQALWFSTIHSVRRRGTSKGDGTEPPVRREETEWDRLREPSVDAHRRGRRDGRGTSAETRSAGAGRGSPTSASNKRQSTEQSTCPASAVACLL